MTQLFNSVCLHDPGHLVQSTPAAGCGRSLLRLGVLTLSGRLPRDNAVFLAPPPYSMIDLFVRKFLAVFYELLGEHCHEVPCQVAVGEQGTVSVVVERF